MVETAVDIELLDNGEGSSTSRSSDMVPPLRRSKRKHSVQSGYTETDESEFDQSPKKLQKYFWLAGGGDLEGVKEHKDGGCEWVANEKNITRLMEEYREKIIRRAEDEDLVEIVDMLVIHHIYYFPKNHEKGVWSHIPDNVHEKVTKDLNIPDGMTRLPVTAVTKIRDLNIVAQDDPKKIRNYLLNYQNETIDDIVLNPFMRCLDQLNTNYENVDDVDVLGEQAFTDTILIPFIRFVFPRNEHFTIDGPSLSSPAVKEAYAQVDSSIIALKPDITVSKRGHELIGGEVKKPQHKYFAVFTDLPKLALELKHMLDHLNSAGPSRQAPTAGILVEG